MGTRGAPVPHRMTRRPALALTLSLLVAASCFAQSPLAPHIASVEKIRGQKFTGDVKNVTIERAKLPAMLREQMAKDLPYSLDEWVAVLRALQLIDVEAKEVLPKLLSLYESQVLAFYDPHSHTYYSLDAMPEAMKGIGDPKMVNEMVAVHELMHALQDQKFGIGKNVEALRRDTDGALAYHAVLEGEALLVMVAHMLAQGGMELDALIKDESLVNTIVAAAQQEQVLDPGTPKYFAESLKFPYMGGLNFVVAAYRRGGWKALDAVHANPPRTTREILHPEEYFARKPAPEKFDAAPHAGVENVLTVEHLGEFNWSFLVGAENARGWVNDRVTITRGATPTVLAETKWESPERAAAFATAYESFLKKRNLSARVVRDGVTVKAAYGPDAKAIERFLPAPAVKAAA